MESARQSAGFYINLLKEILRKILYFFGYRVEKLKDGERDFERWFGKNEDMDLQVLLGGGGEATRHF